MAKTALLGMHDNLVEDIVDYLDLSGYYIIKTTSEAEMLEAIGLSQDSVSDAPPKHPFGVYIMDANLGSPGSGDYGPAKRFYQHVKQSVESGDAVFVAISGNRALVDRAKTDEEFPCINKKGVPDFLSSL